VIKSTKKSLVLGIIVGIVLSAFFFNYFAPRYEIKKTSASTIRIDKWTGRAWRLVEDNWREMADIDEDWELIDKTLQKAINIYLPEFKVDSSAALNRLREKYPVLEDIPDYDLQERIKLVYSKQIMVNMYLGDFLKTDEAQN
jgi:hypothetical protein